MTPETQAEGIVSIAGSSAARRICRISLLSRGAPNAILTFWPIRGRNFPEKPGRAGSGLTCSKPNGNQINQCFARMDSGNRTREPYGNDDGELLSFHHNSSSVITRQRQSMPQAISTYVPHLKRGRRATRVFPAASFESRSNSYCQGWLILPSPKR